LYYFAYASNLSKQPMKERCPESRPGFTATLPHYRLVFAGWSRQWHGGKATIKAFRGEKVRGALYEVTEACLKQLDKYEVGYTRLAVTVFDEDNRAIPAVTHIMSGNIEETPPSKEYAAVIREAYREWGLY
jgi:gamma-glutamylcyclotransferase